VGGASVADLAVVFAEGHVEDMVAGILHRPVVPDQFRVVRRIQR